MVILSVALNTGTEIRDIFITEENKFALVATNSGVEFIDLIRGQVISYATISGGFEPLCLTADWLTSSGLLYVGTSGGGIYSTRYHPARHPSSNFSESLVSHFSTVTSPAISDDIVLDLDSRPGALFVGTAVGVDYISNLTDSATFSFPGGVPRVHMVEDGSTAYWLTASSVAANYDLTSTLGGGIILIDFEYTVDSAPALPSSNPTDIAISEGSPRTLAFSVDSDLFIVEEIQGAEASANTNTITSPTLDFVSVDFAPNTSFSSGYIYGLTPSTSYTFSLLDNSIVGVRPQDLSEAIDAFTLGQTLSGTNLTTIRTTTVPFTEPDA